MAQEDPEKEGDPEDEKVLDTVTECVAVEQSLPEREGEEEEETVTVADCELQGEGELDRVLHDDPDWVGVVEDDKEPEAEGDDVPLMHPLEV